MAEKKPKNRRNTGVDAGEDSPAADLATQADDTPETDTRIEYNIDDVPDDETETLKSDEVEDIADSEALPAMRKVGRKEVLARLLEKNEVILSLTSQNAAQEKQLGELNDKWLRSVAEFENYRKRSRKEWELLKQQAKAEVIVEMLNVVDDFERAFSVVEGDESNEFTEGIRLIYNSMLQTLSRFGVDEFESLNQPFDPIYHMAVGQAESDNVSSGHVVEVVQKGYRLDDTVMRPARVIVAK